MLPGAQELMLGGATAPPHPERPVAAARHADNVQPVHETQWTGQGSTAFAAPAPVQNQPQSSGATAAAMASSQSKLVPTAQDFIPQSAATGVAAVSEVAGSQDGQPLRRHAYNPHAPHFVPPGHSASGAVPARSPARKPYQPPGMPGRK